MPQTVQWEQLVNTPLTTLGAVVYTAPATPARIRIVIPQILVSNDDSVVRQVSVLTMSGGAILEGLEILPGTFRAVPGPFVMKASETIFAACDVGMGGVNLNISGRIIT